MPREKKGGSAMTMNDAKDLALLNRVGLALFSLILRARQHERGARGLTAAAVPVPPRERTLARDPFRER